LRKQQAQQFAIVVVILRNEYGRSHI
jgi:hypothetical protein